MLRTIKELIAEQSNAEYNFKKWKHVLDIIQNAIIISNKTEILYYNKVMSLLLNTSKLDTGNIIQNVIFPLELGGHAL